MTGRLAMLQFMVSQRITTRLSDWTTRTTIFSKIWNFENTMWRRQSLKGTEEGRKNVKRNWREKEGMIQVMFLFFPPVLLLDQEAVLQLCKCLWRIVIHWPANTWCYMSPHPWAEDTRCLRLTDWYKVQNLPVILLQGKTALSVQYTVQTSL